MLPAWSPRLEHMNENAPQDEAGDEDDPEADAGRRQLLSEQVDDTFCVAGAQRREPHTVEPEQCGDDADDDGDEPGRAMFFLVHLDPRLEHRQRELPIRVLGRFALRRLGKTAFTRLSLTRPDRHVAP